MLKLFFGTLKLAALAVVILVLGNWIRWDGKTVSDHVRSQMSHAEKADLTGKVKEWADEAVEKGKRAVTGARAEEKPRQDKPRAQARNGGKKRSEDIFQSERQKLRDLIRELNSFESASAE